MASDNRSITITLKITGDESGGNGGDTSTKTNTNSFVGEDKDSSTKALAKYAATQILSIAANEIVSWGEYYWNRELILNDDYVGQRNKQVAITQINRGINYIGNILSSAAAGSSLGPVGAIIGASIAFKASVASIIRSNVQGMMEQEITLNTLNAELSFTRARAGWSTSAASIGEDL